jgi:hypothetical protein
MYSFILQTQLTTEIEGQRCENKIKLNYSNTIYFITCTTESIQGTWGRREGQQRGGGVLTKGVV